ncbi:heme oxygenase (biliverdin-producing) [Gordonia hydrophobica]|uniref:heme oxygenase (biliverdin-producing) n=1 Tax=Gordonia hydrophobica TaxID=40516 RepID=A0ABZ2U3B0_9ACTN|nr:biliverdin-producing heme oxygenase [Gordonia hydrophobica]MBM7367354.1 heme oxygenase [Gordonia hydrophobica]
MTITTPPDLASDLRLSVQMKEGSRIEHEQAENSEFMAELLDGRINAAGYIAYLQRLRIVYAALEITSRALANDAHVRHVHDPALDRLASIDADLADWSRISGVSLEPVVSPAADAYAQRLTEAAEWGGDLVAHHYTRYLGDLSGGQAVGRILDRSFELDGAGIAMYAFDLRSAVKPYKDDYRRALDTIGDALTPEQRIRIVDEVRVAFALNHDLFAELGRQIEQFRR